jgi:hypothetical protein
MKIKIAIITIGIFLASCGTPSIPVDSLAHLNSNLKLSTAKTIYEDYFDEEDGIGTITHNGKSYTALAMTRVTNTVKRYRGSANNGIGTSGYRQSSKTITPYFIIFENETYFFSGFRYEAVINPNKEVLQILDKLSVSMMEEN